MGCRSAGGFEVIQDGRHFGRHLGFTEKKKLSKTLKIGNF